MKIYNNFYEIDYNRFTEVYHEGVALMYSIYAEELLNKDELFDPCGFIHILEGSEDMEILPFDIMVDDAYFLPSGNWACVWYANNNSGGPSYYIPKHLFTKELKTYIQQREKPIDSQFNRVIGIYPQV